jgi:hypothetical protein
MDMVSRARSLLLSSQHIAQRLSHIQIAGAKDG